ncbi:trigger factor [Stieleria varia]|uniref:Trigger factor n=1 Tax=Stieleria varia TaxID=2528005 RepID=A0A5C6B0P6_9BACT|nr:trigger factor [Stieleria varia]TWU05478.1 Trigger factor [Stieleria varia]
MSTSTEPETTDVAETKPPIQLSVDVKSPQACVREVVVTIPQSEVQRYLKDAYDELVPEAQVPGFRAGRAPRKLVEKQFRERVIEQVKGSLLMDSLSQVTEKQEFSAISEPDFEYKSIEVPEEGDFIYQFTIEVRPEFATPKWKGLKVQKPVEAIEDEDVTEALNRVLDRQATLEATDEPAELKDRLSVTIEFSNNGKMLSKLEEQRITLSERVSFADAVCESFGEKLTGAKEGDTVDVKVKLGANVEPEDLRDKEIDAKVSVLEVLKLERPALTPKLLEELGDFESEEELRSFVRDSLTRQAEYRTQQAVRKSVSDLLAESVQFELPIDLVRRQTGRELERKVLELRRSGFDDDTIRRIVNATRQNAQKATEASLREHFVLEQIAEELQIDAEPSDYDDEIALIAEQSDMPERRVRARLEKSGQMDALRNQIVERKVVDLIIAEADVTEVPVPKDEAEEDNKEFAVMHSVLDTKDDSAIPEAKYDDNTVPGTEPEKKDKDKD